MKLTSNRKVVASSELSPRRQQLRDGCIALKEQVDMLVSLNEYGEFVTEVFPREIAGVPAVRVQLKFGDYDAVIYFNQVKQGVGKMTAYPPKCLFTESLKDLNMFAEWMSRFAGICGQLYRGISWDIPFGESAEPGEPVESASADYIWVVYDEYGEYVCAYPADAEAAAKRKAKELYKGKYQKEQLDPVKAASAVEASSGVYYRVYEHTNDEDHDEIRQVSSWTYDKQAIAWAKRHSNTQTFLSVVKMVPAGHGNWDSEVIWESWEGPDANPLQMHPIQSDVTVKDLADLMRASYLDYNVKELMNTEEELLEWQDAFYCDTSYREGVADYAIANIARLQECMMNQVHVVCEIDDNSSDLLLTICVDGEPVDKIRTWYVADRWDAFLDEL